MNNYPAGAANDPRAPYNEPREMEVEVTVRQVLVKETTVFADGETHECVERDIDPDTGRYEYTATTECDDDLHAAYEDQHLTPLQIINSCHTICRVLVSEYTDLEICSTFNLRMLAAECEGWEEEEIEVG